MEEEVSQPKFSLVERVLGGLFLLFFDALALAADVLGADIGWIIQIPTWLVFTLWFALKGINIAASWEKRILLPILVQALPDWLLPFQLTVSFFVFTYVENHPERFAAAKQATQPAHVLQKRS